MSIRRPGIPAIDPNIPPGIKAILDAMKESIEIANGVRSSGQQVGSGVGFDGWRRRSFTLGMAVKAGLITEAQAMDLYNSES